MSILQYDPDEWLLSATRSLESYVKDKVDDELVNVEMSYPNTDNWTKETPLAKTLIHFEQDDQTNPRWGFGHPGEEVFTPSPDAGVSPGLWRIDEAQQHTINFDVGVWASDESGGATARMKYQQLLVNLFGYAGAQTKLYEDTGGIWVVSYSGGTHRTDRINDLPVWRALSMTLIVRIFSRHEGVNEVVPDDFDQTEDLTIADTDGTQVSI